MRRGSALILALWTIVVLSILVMAFTYEAKQQSGLNTYVQERNRANHIIEAGKVLAEMILVDYPNVADWSKDQDEKELFEKDAWFREKQELKKSSRCTIGPVALDEENPASALVTITIEASNSGADGIININQLYSGSDNSGTAGNADIISERWWMIFRAHGIPEEFTTRNDGRINLWDVLISSWQDWRDSDSLVTSVEGKECGAEDEWYEEIEDKIRRVDEKTMLEFKRRPRNGPIPALRELQYVRGFRDYPALLTGGILNDWEKEESRQITVRGLEHLFCTEGSVKINVNSCESIDALVSIPGIYRRDDVDRDDDRPLEDAKERAQAILDTLKVRPRDDDDLSPEDQQSYPFKDWNDMCKRLDENSNVGVRSDEIGSEAKDYLSFEAEKETVFKVRIEAISGGMVRAAEAECYVKDKKVRYVKWTEAPSSKN